jgi:Putative zinc-finger
MEHLEAKRMYAAEMYVLGELSEDLREQFEDHYFDCAECSLDVRAAAAFIAASKEVFQELPVPVARTEKRKAFGWRTWLKPLVAVTAVAALVVMTVYEGRNLRRPISETPAAADQNLVASADYGLRGGEREADGNTVVKVRDHQAIGLHFDFTPSQIFGKYLGEVRDEAGRTLMQVAIPADRINKEVKLIVPGGKLRPGNYVLWIYGESGAKSVVSKYAFTVVMNP